MKLKTNEKLGTFISFIGMCIVLALASTVEFNEASLTIKELLALSAIGFSILGLGVYIINW